MRILGGHFNNMEGGRMGTTIELFEACPYCKSLDISSLEGSYFCNGCDHAFMDVIWIDEEEHEWQQKSVIREKDFV